MMQVLKEEDGEDGDDEDDEDEDDEDDEGVVAGCHCATLIQPRVVISTKNHTVRINLSKAQ